GYLPLFERGTPIAAYVHRGYFYEHSTPERYLQGNLNLVRGGVSLPARPGPLSGVNAQAEVAKDAMIVGPVLVSAGAEVASGAHVGPNVIVGAGGRVGAGAHVEESVIWSGAEVAPGASLRRAIVTSRRVVKVPAIADPWARPR
ncbi:MAG: hypothetical protein KAI47_26890, partial [Deltaproteobacteria bacterium]|nr:hypothetical protein [Deltaproteobacteria bacterium]